MQPLEETFRILRVRVEAQAAPPAVLVVSAAKRHDGTTYVACGLARAFAESGKRTLLVDANTPNPGVARQLATAQPRPGRRLVELGAHEEIPRLTVSSLIRPADEGPVGEGSLQSVLDEMRSAYAVTVIDAPPLPASSIALQLAHAANGLLLAVRTGRKTDRADEEVKRLLGKTAPLLGIVPTQARATRGGLVLPFTPALRRGEPERSTVSGRRS
jgi:Mrp family chromosome partitioning ATPase